MLTAIHIKRFSEENGRKSEFHALLHDCVCTLTPRGDLCAKGGRDRRNPWL
jgi:hypothetical protein